MTELYQRANNFAELFSPKKGLSENSAHAWTSWTHWVTHLSHDLFVDLDFRLSPVDPLDGHVEEEEVAGHEHPASQSCVAMAVVLHVEEASSAAEVK